MNIEHGVCQDCAEDGDQYHAFLNRYPLGTTFRCTECAHLFGGLATIESKPKEWNYTDGPAMRAVIGAVMLFIIGCLFCILAIALTAERQAKAGEADEAYMFAMRHYRYGSVTNQVWIKIHYEYETNIVPHGNIKRELVYLLEVGEIEGRTNRYVLADEFIGDRIILPRQK